MNAFAGKWLLRRRTAITNLVRLACVLALLALAAMCYSIVSPQPLPVIFAMSIGHAIGGAAFLLYLLAVLLDVSRSQDKAGASPGSKSERDQ